MFSKLLQKGLKKDERRDDAATWELSDEEFQAPPRLPNFSKNKIRILIYRDCEKRGKSLLFDTDGVVKIEEKKTQKSSLCGSIGSSSSSESGRSTPSDAKIVHDEKGTPKYKCLRPNSDTKLLGEMIFGSVAMIYRGGSIEKVHLIRSPPCLLMTKVFPLKMESDQAEFCESLSTCSLTQSGSYISPRRNISFDTLSLCSHNGSPGDTLRNSQWPGSTNKLNYSSGLYRSFSESLTSIDSLNMSTCSSMLSLNSSPVGSLQRRWYRSQATSMDLGQLLKGPKGSSEESLASRRQPKLAIAVMFKLWDGNEEKSKAFQNFFFAHYSLFECHLERLRAAMEKSIYQRKSFFHAAMDASQNFSDKIYKLFYSPRIVSPVWLQLSQNTDSCCKQSHTFMSVLVRLTNLYEKKETKFFISSLLTAVLTHHLSWVATVMPVQSLPYRAYLNKHSSKQLDVLAKCHPYNPLWEQLSDLYGSLGTSHHITKTVIVGKHGNLIKQLLYLLTYFLRCSTVVEHLTKINADIVSACEISVAQQTPNNRHCRQNDIARTEDDCDDTSCLCEVINDSDDVGCRNLKTLHEENSRFCNSNAHSVDQSTLLDNGVVQRQPSFTCYCCTDQHETLNNHLISSDARALHRQCSSSSNQATCTECNELDKCNYTCRNQKLNSAQDGDSDYCSIANEDVGNTVTVTEDSHGTNSDSDSATDSMTDDLDSLHLLEIPMPSPHQALSYDSRSVPRKNVCSTFGTSLLAGYCDSYTPDFVLQGIPSLDQEEMIQDLQYTIKHCALDESISDASCIIANTDTWSCEVWKLSKFKDDFSDSSREELVRAEIFTSSLISSMLDAVKGLSEIDISPEFCMMHIEDRLRNVYDRSTLLTHYVASKGRMLTRTELEDKFGYRGSDLDLILSVAGTHSPYIFNVVDTES